MKTHRPKFPWEVYELAEKYVEDNAPFFLRWIGKDYLINLFSQAYYRGKEDTDDFYADKILFKIKYPDKICESMK